MQPKDTHEDPDLFRIRLNQFIDMNHELVILTGKLNWSRIEKQICAFYVVRKGRPGAPVHLMAGLHYLKHRFKQSDKAVVNGFVENPYWQFFCGYDYFEKSPPVNPSSLTRFRKRIGPKGMAYLLRIFSVKAGLKLPLTVNSKGGRLPTQSAREKKNNKSG